MLVDVGGELEGRRADLVLVPNANLVTGRRELERQLGAELTSLECDLLTVAAAVYAADLAARRGEREHACRSIELVIPIVNLHVLARVRDDIQYALYLLSRDAWTLTFSRAEGTPEALREWPEADGTTLLFSGGLDSLSAAIRESEARTPLTLVSHYTGNTTTISAQRALQDYLADRFGDVDSVRVKTGGRRAGDLEFPDDAMREPSQRTRSFLFVVLATIVARRTGNRKVVMVAENGPLAVHLALSTARLGPFSTHTAHPEYLEVAQAVLRDVLGVDLLIENPFLYLTKAEVVQDVVVYHRAAVQLSVSCWRGSRQAVNHCGDCVPCLVRRLSLEHNGYSSDEYARDLLNEDLSTLKPDDDGLRNLTDLLEFGCMWAASLSEAALIHAFPELVNPSIDQPLAIGMYRRFGAEVVNGARRYPGAAALIGP